MFDLLSVSQMQTIRRNTLDLAIKSPKMRLYAGDDHGIHLTKDKKRKYVDIPLSMDEGLYCLTLEPVSSDDTRHQTLQSFIA